MYVRLNLCEMHFQSHYADFIYAILPICPPVCALSLSIKAVSSYHSPSLCPALWRLQCLLKQYNTLTYLSLSRSRQRYPRLQVYHSYDELSRSRVPFHRSKVVFTSASCLYNSTSFLFHIPVY